MSLLQAYLMLKVLMKKKLKSLFDIRASEPEGFTIVEVAVVMGVISILGSFAIPNVLNTIKLSRIEEAKALMNSYAADCLGQYRISTDIKEFNKKAPENLSKEKLKTLGYSVNPEKSKCSALSIKPLNERDKDLLYQMGFQIYEDNEIGSVKVFKEAIPSDNPNPRSLPSCRGWAGDNCGLSPEALAAIARLKQIAINKANCGSEITKKGMDKWTGPIKTWVPPEKGNAKDLGSCKFLDPPKCMFEGNEYRNCEEVEAARKRKYGALCEEWQRSKVVNKAYITSNANGETKSPECAGQLFWFHTGQQFDTKEDFEEKKESVKKTQCDIDKSNKKNTQFTGIYKIQPADGIKEPCGTTYHFCKGEALTSVEYQSSSCNKSSGGGGDGDNDQKEDDRGNVCPNKSYRDNQGIKCCPGRINRNCIKSRSYRSRTNMCKCWY
ncbi:type II secretion system protein [Prochlorococcus sp. MIT 0601]|uniref:type IV pilin protein n=1 Tax=Prochlorococcus sp. MIT 0601 TaxID=1499498 RepID=UPI00055A4FD8|nr:type II secretion system protein [Prochlorococcus sp. MIT 0601]